MRSPLAPLIPVLLPLPFSIALRLSDLLCGVLSDCVDVLDECDEVLRHKYQLIYAVGDRTPLPSGDLRWAAVQALCRVIKHHGGGRETALASVLADADVAVWEEGGHKPEAFNRLRLLRGEAMQTALPTLHMALAEALLDEPPYELRWLKEKGQKGNGSLRGAILRYITDAASLEDKGGLERELGKRAARCRVCLCCVGCWASASSPTRCRCAPAWSTALTSGASRGWPCPTVPRTRRRRGPSMATRMWRSAAPCCPTTMTGSPPRRPWRPSHSCSSRDPALR